MTSKKNTVPSSKHTRTEGDDAPDEGKAEISRKKAAPKPNGADQEGGAQSQRKATLGFTGRLKRCRKRAAGAVALDKRATALGERATLKLETALAHTFRLKVYTDRKPKAKMRLMRAYKKADIKINGSTTSDFIPLVKLVFSKDTPAATVGRYAGALRLAKQEGVKAADFVAFLRKNGGVTGCAALATQKRGEAALTDKEAKESAARIRKDGGVTECAETECAELATEKQTGAADQPSPAELLKQKLRERRKDAPVFLLPEGVNLPGEGLHMLLVRSRKGRKCRCFGSRPATDHEALSILKD